MRVALWFLVLASAARGASAQSCETPDAYEPNDTCGAAVALTPGSYPGLSVQGAASTGGSSPDHYAITLPAGEQLDVDAFFSTSLGDVDLELYGDPACAQLVDASYSLTDDEHVSWVNLGPSTADLVLVVRGYGAGFACNDYDLLVATSPDPCAALVPDAGEDDDDCAIAAPLFGGATTGRNVDLADPDWFVVDLDAEQGFTCQVSFTHADGDIDVRLWDACPTTGAQPFAISQSETDDEHVAFGNASPNPLQLWVEVYVWSGSAQACNEYEVFVTFEGGDPATKECAGDGSYVVTCPCGNLGTVGEGCANSSGTGAALAAGGTAVHAADDLVLHVAGARPLQPGLALQGGSLIALPFRDGILCVGPPTERLEILALDDAGTAQTSVSIVQEGHVAGPGETTWYQVWYRDPAISPCGSGSNFSNALRVDWI